MLPLDARGAPKSDSGKLTSRRDGLLGSLPSLVLPSPSQGCGGKAAINLERDGQGSYGKIKMSRKDETRWAKIGYVGQLVPPSSFVSSLRSPRLLL